jgi:hypothetical protein
MKNLTHSSMTAAEKIVQFGDFSRAEQPEETLVPDIYAGLVSALKLIKQHTNGHQVEVSMETHNIQGGTWKKRLVAQQIEFNVKITIKEETK